MAHESFEDLATAQALNERFVSIKVDREERPDVDAVYMQATVATTGHGGWPMTVFATPGGRPFYCGTYYPDRPRHGMPAFRQVLTAVSDAWTTRRQELEEAGGRITAGIASRFDLGPPAPEHAVQRRELGGSADAEALRMARATLEAMARGGIYDQLAGGFARYSVDPHWVVPHFEKMLYDNALLARVYAHWWRATGSALARRVALETCDWMLAELLTGEGGFASALDADSEGEEGKFYVFTPAEVGPVASDLFSVTDAGTFEHGRSVLQLLDDPVDQDQYAAERARLLELRARRVRPARDDKVVAAWNGLAIAALADCGLLFDRPDLIAAAGRCAELLADVHVEEVDGEQRLRRVSRDGVAGQPVGVLEDYADVAEGLLTLHQANGERRWLDLSGDLLRAAVRHFPDGEGGFFDTADDAERLVRRPRDPTDNATPSGLSALAGALTSYAALTADTGLRETAERAVGTLAAVVARYPRFAGWAAAVGEAQLAGPLEVAVVDAPELAAVARRATSPGAVVVTGGDSPLLADRPAGAAYVCRGFVCDAPTRDAAVLGERLGVRVHPERTGADRPA
jgi:uncharacterized protein YyaL (SSP411 family)